MARIAGVDIPDNKIGEISLTYIYGIGRSSAKKILDKAGVTLVKKAKDWDEAEATAIRTIITSEFKTEGVLRSEFQMSIKRLMDIGCYRGLRHRKVYLFVVKAPKTMQELEKVNVKLWLTRKKLLNSL